MLWYRSDNYSFDTNFTFTKYSFKESVLELVKPTWSQERWSYIYGSIASLSLTERMNLQDLIYDIVYYGYCIWL